MIHTIPYFDAHCDTIHRCHTAGTLFRDPELRAFYDTAGDLRRSGGHIDLERAGGFSRYAQFFALYQSPRLVPEGSSMPEQGVLLHQRFLREMEENRERILPCRTGAEVDEAVGQGKAAALLSIEGAELLDCDIRRLDTAYDWGVRLLNPVWNYANRLSGSNAQQPEQGLTAYGRDFLPRMEELSIYVDVSHLSDAGFWDVVRLSRRPVVASHSNSRAICPHRRNLTDDMFRAIRDSGGVAGLNYYQHFVGDDPTMEGLVRHVEHFPRAGTPFRRCHGEFRRRSEACIRGVRQACAHLRSRLYRPQYRRDTPLQRPYHLQLGRAVRALRADGAVARHFVRPAHQPAVFARGDRPL